MTQVLLVPGSLQNAAQMVALGCLVGQEDNLRKRDTVDQQAQFFGVFFRQSTIIPSVGKAPAIKQRRQKRDTI